MNFYPKKFPSVLLCDYEAAIVPTDRLSTSNLRPVLMGLFGEVGGIMTSAKKKLREKEAYNKFHSAAVEEFGDALWYFAALARRGNKNLDAIFLKAVEGVMVTKVVATGCAPGSAIAQVYSINGVNGLEENLLELGTCASALFELARDGGIDEDCSNNLMIRFATSYLKSLKVAEMDLSEVVQRNLEKVLGRFTKFDPVTAPTFDMDFMPDEQLPMQFEIHIEQRPNGQSYLKWNGVFIGDPLTDNIADPDGYRFHDVFHLAYAAILHWSPVFRALIKHKRKSDKQADETQDGGRAVVVEEGLTAWLFAEAKQLNFFEKQDTISFDTLKIVHQFVQGYEVEQCRLNLWEYAILEGYKVFRQVRQSNGGIIVGDRSNRTITFKPKLTNDTTAVCKCTSSTEI